MSYSQYDVTPSYNPYGKEGSFARAEAAKSTGTLDDKTRKELEAYVNNSAGQFDENVVSKARELLKYWTPTTITATSGSDAQFAHDARLKAIEEQRTYAEKLAEQARQDAIKNAYITYDRSLPTFGQNAERLAQMGLSNSGYSDYLGGVAYSSMVGGVQDAHKTANKAIQDAYYNAELQKAQAADTLYDRQVAENKIAYDRAQDKAEIDAERKKAYTATLSGIIAGAGSGTYNENTALSLAYANGINETDIQKIIDAANAYKTQNEIIKKQERAKTFAEILTGASYGDYTAEEIQALASMHGFSPEETEVLLEAVYRYLAYMMNETTTYNGSGGSTTTYQITDEYGNTKTVSSVKGH